MDDDFDIDEDIKPSVALVPSKKKTNSELVLDLAKNDGNTALVAMLDRMTQLETVNGSVREVIMAARDLEKNYTIPGNQRFKRVVRLRKALDELEDKVKRGRL